MILNKDTVQTEDVETERDLLELPEKDFNALKLTAEFKEILRMFRKKSEPATVDKERLMLELLQEIAPHKVSKHNEWVAKLRAADPLPFRRARFA